MKYLIIFLFTVICLISLINLGMEFNDRFFLIGLLGFAGVYLSILWLVSPQATQTTQTTQTTQVKSDYPDYTGARDGDSVTQYSPMETIISSSDLTF